MLSGYSLIQAPAKGAYPNQPSASPFPQWEEKTGTDTSEDGIYGRSADDQRTGDEQERLLTNKRRISTIIFYTLYSLR